MAPLSRHLAYQVTLARHCLHVLPGENNLELGGGTGLWCRHLTQELRGENPITAAVFNDAYANDLERKFLPNVRVLRIQDLAQVPAAAFEYIVGTAILRHDLYAQNLRALQLVRSLRGSFRRLHLFNGLRFCPILPEFRDESRIDANYLPILQNCGQSLFPYTRHSRVAHQSAGPF